MSHERFHHCKKLHQSFYRRANSFQTGGIHTILIAGAVFMVLIFIISGIEKEIQICYSEATKGNQEAAYPE